VKYAAAIILVLMTVSVASAAAAPRLNQAIVNEIQRSMVPIEGSKLCARIVGKTTQRVDVYTEAVRDVPPQAAQVSAMTNAGTVRDVLEKHRLSVPAYVEVSSPKRWYGVAVYDNKSQRVLWFRCTKNCEQLGTRRIKRCR
jgi:hypothetical protein